MTRISELVIYRNFEHGEILEDMAWIMDHYQNPEENREKVRTLFFNCIHGLIELAASYGFEHNIWHNYLTFLLVNNENAYSKSCEIVGAVEGTINNLALHDFAIFKELYDYDFSDLSKALESDCFKVIEQYENIDKNSKLFNKRIRDRICDLSLQLGKAKSVEEFMSDMTLFYQEFGVGKLGLHKAFRIQHKEEGAEIVPITKIAHVKLDDLVGYEIAKKKLIENTEAFVQGRKANNCLLFGGRELENLPA